jgi:hypothetical protein
MVAKTSFRLRRTIANDNPDAASRNRHEHILVGRVVSDRHRKGTVPYRLEDSTDDRTLVRSNLPHFDDALPRDELDT